MSEELLQIELRGINALGTHGVLPEERDRPQPFEIDLDVTVLHSAAATSDKLADTVDYGVVAENVARIVENTSFGLLERLANAIADAVLASPAVGSVTVTVRKLRPAVAVQLTSAGVTITRRRS